MKELRQRGYHPDQKQPTAEKKPWMSQYYDRLESLGWKFTTNAGRINSTFVAANDKKTPELLNAWRVGGNPVEISIVIVPPNGDLADLPARALAYGASALSFASGLRKSNITIDSLRIMSPCHSNVYANGGDLDSQMFNAKKIRTLVQGYKENYFSELDDVRVTLDTGNPITIDVEIDLEPSITYIQKEHPDIAKSLYEVSLRYGKNSNQQHLMDDQQRPLVYLLTHPPAWGYSEEEILFGRNGERRINFMPASELRYLEYIKRIEGRAWMPSVDKQIATVISAKQTRAPYHRIAEEEPSLGDFTETSFLQLSINRLRPNVGRVEIAEVIANLNLLKTDAKQINRQRRKTTLPFEQLISQNL